MMVKIWNKNSIVHREKYKGVWIEIPPGKAIEMDYHDAIDFKGQFFNPVFSKGGQQTIESMKYLVIDPEDNKRALDELNQASEEKSSRVFVCMRCNKEFKSKKALAKHVKDMHVDELVDEKTRDELDEELGE